MKRRVLILSLILSGFKVAAQDLQWAKSFVTANAVDYCYGVTSNGNDRLGLIGLVSSGTPLDWNGLDPTSSVTSNYFTSNYDYNGNFQWAHVAPGYPYDICMDDQGNTFVAGRFSGTVDFDPTANAYSLTSAGGGYIQKFNTSGDFQWAVKDDLDGHISQVVVGDNNNIYYAGEIGINAVATLSNGQTVNVNIGAYIGEVSPTGELLNVWNIEVPGVADYIYVYELEVNNGKLYIAGSLDGVADFDVTSGQVINPHTNVYDAWIAQYDLAGGMAIDWHRIIGAQGWDSFHGLAVDEQGTVYAGGTFCWTVDFDATQPGTFSLMSDNNTQTQSIFFMQYNPAGVTQWVKKIGNTNVSGDYNVDDADVVLRDLRITSTQIMLLGHGKGQILMDGVNTSTNLPTGSVAAPGLVIGEYDLTGSLVGAFNVDSLGGPVGFFGGLDVQGLHSLQGNRWLVAGTFQQRINFGSDAAPFYIQTDPSSPNYGFDRDIYVACYGGSQGVGIKEIPSTEQWVKLINPVEDQLKIITDQTDINWSITSLSGAHVLSGSEKVTDLTHLTSGVYIIEVFGEDKPVQRVQFYKN